MSLSYKSKKDKRKELFKDTLKYTANNFFVLIFGIVAGGLLISLSYSIGFERYSVAENESVHYNPEVFNEMRGEYSREVSTGNFSEDIYCMYGESNSSGIYIKDLEKAVNHNAGMYTVRTDQNVTRKVHGVYGQCISHSLPFNEPTIDRYTNDLVKGGVHVGKMFIRQLKGEEPDERYLGSCHSHPPSGSESLSAVDLKNWDQELLNCIMYNENPFIYTQSSVYHHVNN